MPLLLLLQRKNAHKTSRDEFLVVGLPSPSLLQYLTSFRSQAKRQGAQLRALLDTRTSKIAAAWPLQTASTAVEPRPAFISRKYVRANILRVEQSIVVARICVVTALCSERRTA